MTQGFSTQIGAAPVRSNADQKNHESLSKSHVKASATAEVVEKTPTDETFSDEGKEDPTDPAELERPIQGDDESDEDYKQRVLNWRGQKAAAARKANKAKAE